MQDAVPRARELCGFRAIPCGVDHIVGSFELRNDAVKVACKGRHRGRVKEPSGNVEAIFFKE